MQTYFGDMERTLFGIKRSVARITLCTLAIAACCLASGCVDLTAVNDFAKESSLISSNKAMLDDTDAQEEARAAAVAIGQPNAFEDPASKDFQDHLAVTQKALDALNGYMTALSKLSANDTANVGSDFSSIEAGLQSLHVSNPALDPTVKAVGALTHIVLGAIAQNDIKQLITSAAGPVDQVTAYLIDQAQTTANTYVQAVASNNAYWGAISTQGKEDKTFCESHNICNSVVTLENRERKNDLAALNQKAAIADAAVKAFEKIRKDNAALANSVDHLDAKELLATLKSDEPDLLTAIHNLSSI